jgi:hypothetical protein
MWLDIGTSATTKTARQRRYSCTKAAQRCRYS